MIEYAYQDDIVRTHDEMLDLLRHAVPGAIVTLRHSIKEKDLSVLEASAAYEVRLPAAPHVSTGLADFYSLPCSASAMAQRARDLVSAVRPKLRMSIGQCIVTTQ